VKKATAVANGVIEEEYVKIGVLMLSIPIIA
jgi:hypothetical protein